MCPCERGEKGISWRLLAVSIVSLDADTTERRARTDGHGGTVDATPKAATAAG